MERFQTERKEMMDKIEANSKSMSNKDRELTIMKSKYESMVEELSKKKKINDELKNDYTNEKEKLNEKIEQLRQKH